MMNRNVIHRHVAEIIKTCDNAPHGITTDGKIDVPAIKSCELALEDCLALAHEINRELSKPPTCETCDGYQDGECYGIKAYIEVHCDCEGPIDGIRVPSGFCCCAHSDLTPNAELTGSKQRTETRND